MRYNVGFLPKRLARFLFFRLSIKCVIMLVFYLKSFGKIFFFSFFV